MGGSSSYEPGLRSKEESKNLFQSAVKNVQQKLDDGQTGGKKNAFISFHGKDIAAVNLLRYQATRDDTPLEFNDLSIARPTEEWKKIVRERIEKSAATIVMIGPETATRENVLYEIQVSYELGKKVIGVKIRADKDDPIPEIMRQRKAPIVNWNLEDIQKEIDKA